MSFIEIEAEFIKQEATFLGAVAAVRIENTTDEIFWATVFSATIPDKKIAFYPYSNSPTPKTTGKISVLKYTPFADAQLWLCIDSDYDYLRQIPELNNPFIFQTYVYAVENYQCFAPNLSKILQSMTALSIENFDFEPFLIEYSQIVYELLICSILAEDTEGVSFSALDCGQTIALPQHFEDTKSVLETLKLHVALQLNALKLSFSTDSHTKTKKEEFEQLGLTQSNAYLFIRGHNLLNNVVKPLLEHYAYRIKNRHLLALRQITNIEERNVQLQHYIGQTMTVEKAVNENTDFTKSVFFLKIQGDIRQLFVKNQ